MAAWDYEANGRIWLLYLIKTAFW